MHPTAQRPQAHIVNSPSGERVAAISTGGGVSASIRRIATNRLVVPPRANHMACSAGQRRARNAASGKASANATAVTSA
jgi:hypothetical protein